MKRMNKFLSRYLQTVAFPLRSSRDALGSTGFIYLKYIVFFYSAFVFRSIAWSFHDNHFGVVYKTIGNRRCDGGVVEDIPPPRKDKVAGYHG